MKKYKIFSNYRGRIFSVIAANVITNIPRGFFNGIIYMIILGLCLPMLNNQAVDYIRLNQFFLIYLAAFLIYIVFSIFSSINTFVQSYTISTDIRMRLGEKLRKLSLGFFKSNDPGDVTSRMLHDVNKAEETLSHNLIDHINFLILPLLIGAFLIFINVKLTLLLFSTVMVAFIFFYTAKRIIYSLGKKHLKALNEASSRILEYTGSIKLLKSFNMLGENFTELDKAMKKLKKLSFQSEVFTGIPVQAALLILDFGYFAMLLLASSMAINKTLTIPDLFSFAILGFYFFEPIKQLGITVVLMRHAKNSTDRIEEIINETEPEYIESHTHPERNDIVFENVSFQYKNTWVLRNLNCTFPENKMTALVGMSGSGKTTITNLIARFWDVQEGRILYGSEDVKKYQPDFLLQKISMVFQDVFLFNDTIANNIRMGRMNATDEDIIEAAKQAQCHEFISKLPHGYNTMISEGGRSLSGGEKQRISIARAILKNAPVILLDEATASLDPENEFEIQKALDHLTKNKTIIVIAHKFSSILNADQILVIDKGKVKESGIHSELISHNGLYKKLWDLQMKSGSWKMKE